MTDKKRKVRPEKGKTKSKSKFNSHKKLIRRRTAHKLPGYKFSAAYIQKGLLPGFSSQHQETEFCSQFVSVHPKTHVKIIGTLFSVSYFLMVLYICLKNNFKVQILLILSLSFVSGCCTFFAMFSSSGMMKLNFGAKILPVPIIIWVVQGLSEIVDSQDILLLFGIVSTLFSFSFLQCRSFFISSLLSLLMYTITYVAIELEDGTDVALLFLRIFLWAIISYNVLYQNHLRRKIWGQLRITGIENPFTDSKNSFKLGNLFSSVLQKSLESQGKPEIAFDKSVKAQLEMLEQNPACQSLLVRTNRLEKLDVIGRGATGEVYETLYLDSHVAFKVINLNSVNNNLGAEFLHELNITSECRHPNIVQLLGVVCSVAESTLGFLLELMPRGCLRDVLEDEINKSELDWLDPKSKFAIDICKGMIFLHERKLVHRDLKTENVLVNQSLTCKISDLATAKRLNGIDRCSTIIGTPFWRAPEMFRKECYDEKVDVFSFSILLLELQIQKNPFHDMNSSEQLEYPHSVKRKGFSLPIPIDTPKRIRKLIRRCGRLESYMRPSFNTIRREVQNFVTSLEGFETNQEKGLRELGKLMFDQVIVSRQYKRHEYEPNEVIIEIDSEGSECFIVLQGIVEILVPIKKKSTENTKGNNQIEKTRKLSLKSWNIHDEVQRLLEELLLKLENEYAFAHMKFISVGKVLKYDYFGEMALLARSRRAARCIAQTRVTCISFTEHVFNTVFDNELRMLLASNVLVKLSGNNNQNEIDSKYKSQRNEIFLKAQRISTSSSSMQPV